MEFNGVPPTVETLLLLFFFACTVYKNLEWAVFLNITIPWIMCAKSAHTTIQKKLMATNGLKWKQLTRQTCRIFANKTARNNIQHNFRLNIIRTNTQTAHAGLCNILIIIK